jgi:pantoate--beta-alanine ligase
MRICSSIPELRQWRASTGGSVGLVPTMGALHEGHLSLIRQASAENEHVVVSIFVNPRQFNEQDDFARYPRTIERDLSLLRNEAVDAVFTPDPDEMYPPDAATRIQVRELADRLEGASRPGHFEGVALVVCKLLNIVQPDRAYFGRKDAQQVVVIQKMVDDLNMPVEIVPVETVRDPDGVAISSRNAFLSPVEREAAGRIPAALFAAVGAFELGERSADRLRDLVRTAIEEEPLLSVDYVSLADSRDLRELSRIDRPAVLSIAVWCGGTRLIDNVRLESPGRRP